MVDIYPYKKSERQRNCNPFHCWGKRSFFLYIATCPGQRGSGQHILGNKPRHLTVALAQMLLWGIMGSLGHIFKNAWKYLAYSNCHLYIETSQPSVCCTSPHHRTPSPTSYWHKTFSRKFIMFKYISKILLRSGEVSLKNYFPTA